MSNYAIILAGGSGTRFWPLSTDNQPKQFLKVSSDKSMLEETINRISGLIGRKDIYLAANIKHKKILAGYIKKLRIPRQNVLFEPVSKNTLAPIAVLSHKIRQKDPLAVIAVLPSDHIIKDNKKFALLLAEAIKSANQGNITAFGIKPSRPETGYGYIKINSKVKIQKAKIKRDKRQKAKFGSKKQKCNIHNSTIYAIDKFIEKPVLARAKQFIKNNQYFWNSGIFIFKAEVLLEEVNKLQPAVYEKICSGKRIAALWPEFPAISIDYAVMEKTDKIALLPADYGWVDQGSWKMLEETAAKDKNGNIIRGNNLDIDSRDSIIWAEKRLVATIGLDNIIVVDTKDALLVCAKSRTQDVKKIVGILKKRNNKR